MNKIKKDITSINNEEKDKLILEEKQRGNSDFEIGKKYGVNYKYIEELVTKKRGVNLNHFHTKRVISNLAPKDFQIQKSTVWSFKQRGNWATHSGEYRGNWSPYIPRNIILKYSKQGDLVLDYFCGAGTTVVEAKLLGRRCIALDINPHAVELAKENCKFKIGQQHLPNFNDQLKEVYEPVISTGDARSLSNIKDNSIDLICAHPPYANIIQYTDNKKDDLSFLDIDDFLKEMEKVAQESFRVLKPDHQCAILIGDTRRKKHIIPLGFKLIDVFLRAGFRLRELIIKRQHNCKTTGFWYTNSIKYNFLLLAHEYLPIFEKPKSSALRVEERGLDYGLIFSTLGRPPQKRKLDGLETTTMWVLPKTDFEKHLNKNVIDRYSNGNGYLTIFLNSQTKHETREIAKKEQKNRKLLFIKSPSLNDNSKSNIKLYLQKIKEIIDREVDTINNNGFIAIQTQDIRVDEYIEPLAKKIIDMFTQDNLQLKEIIMVTEEREKGVNFDNQNLKDHLKITHQYILVYKVIKGEK